MRCGLRSECARPTLEMYSGFRIPMRLSEMDVDKDGQHFQTVKHVKNMVALWIASRMRKTRMDLLNMPSYDFVISQITTVA